MTIAAMPWLAASIAGLVGAVLLDALARPRAGRRSPAGLWLLGWQAIAASGLFLMLGGSVVVSVALTLALLAFVVLASNAKHAMLGEPLLFSDLALIGAIFRHPQFYLSAIGAWQRMAVGLVAAALVGVMTWLFVPDVEAHLAGAGLMLGALAVLAASLRAPPLRDLARVPAIHADVHRHGLTPTLLLYWLRWRESRDPLPPALVERQIAPDPAPLLIVVQCESFADPVELFGDAGLALPGLAAARDAAWQHGRLEVSGFGAYTMRTEYGVIFGREEAALGFRRYDPFLTALGETGHALPARLGPGWRSWFVHPHDLRFYGRDRIMPACGFADLVGEGDFAPPALGEGRYVTDATVAARLLDIAAAADRPTLLYAVTIENHGPWAPDAAADADLVHGFLRLARHSDAMLTTLMAGLAALERPALLVFFGDHRPSIPGAVVPGADRHTPYVMVRLDDRGRIVRGAGRRVDLTPAGLHHLMLDAVLGAPV